MLQERLVERDDEFVATAWLDGGPSSCLVCIIEFLLWQINSFNEVVVSP